MAPLGANVHRTRGVLVSWLFAERHDHAAPQRAKDSFDVSIYKYSAPTAL